LTPDLVGWLVGQLVVSPHHVHRPMHQAAGVASSPNQLVEVSCALRPQGKLAIHWWQATETAHQAEVTLLNVWSVLQMVRMSEQHLEVNVDRKVAWGCKE